MVTVSFGQGGIEIARIQVAHGQPVATAGNCGWIDFGFQPHSERLGRPVAFAEDAEEWARSLPAAYAASSLTVTATEAPTPAEIPAPALPMPTTGIEPGMPGAPAFAQPPAPVLTAGDGSPTFRLAGWGTRAAALLLDSLIVGIPAGVLGTLLFGGVHTTVTSTATNRSVFVYADWKQILVSMFLGLTYFLIATTRKGERNGQSMGKRILKIRIVRDDGQPVTTGTALRRYGTLYGLSLLCGIGSLFDYLWPLGDSTNRALHDKTARTHVIDTLAPGQRRGNAGAVIAGILGVILLVGLLLAIALPTFIHQSSTTDAAQQANSPLPTSVVSSYTASFQQYEQAAAAFKICTTSKDRSGPLQRPACETSTGEAFLSAMENLAQISRQAQATAAQGSPCRTALDREVQAGTALISAAQAAQNALQTRNARALEQSGQQFRSAQQAALRSETAYPLTACGL